MMQRMLGTALLFLVVCGSLMGQARIQDLIEVEGVQKNQISGIGLVTGLNNTGDSQPAARALARTFARRMGINLPPGGLSTSNMAVVIVTASLPPFVRPGSRIDVTISSFGDAESLRGGELMQTQLTGPDRRTVYALAQGALIVGGVTARGSSGSKATINHPTVGQIANGAEVVKEVTQRFFGSDGRMRLLLRKTSYQTAKNLADAINELHAQSARPIDGRTVEVRVPTIFEKNPVGFLSAIGDLRIKSTVPGKVVISERHGIVVAGAEVLVNPVAISQSNLSITVNETPEVSQPAPFTESSETVIVPRSDIQIEKQGIKPYMFTRPVTVGDLAAALNDLGVAPDELITIFTMLDGLGAIQGEVLIK
jgi:flagellar P-ring protein precursor FlgI